MASDPVLIMQLIIPVLERLNVVYWLGGSIASAVHGEFRATNDINFVADLRAEHVEPLVTALQDDFYIDAESVREAIELYSSFNAIHLATAYKADFFIVAPTPWMQEEAERRRQELVGGGDENILAYVASPEDMILQKLNWFRMGGEVSDRQWGDVQGMLKVQAETLEYDYLLYWAAELKLTDLLEQALGAAGIWGSNEWKEQ